MRLISLLEVINLTSLTDYIGNTPLIRLTEFEKRIGSGSRIYAKLEKYNPFGSIKDRAAYQILKDAGEFTDFDRDTCVIEATSGNMGISLSAICAIVGYKCKIIMPKNASDARKKLIKHYGAELILCDANGGMSEATKIAELLSKEDHNIYWCKQFFNKSNIKAHYISTAPEIERQLGSVPDAIFSGIGTGGTIMGLAEFFKAKGSMILGVEPKSSPVITQKRTGKHKIQGIGANFYPPLVNISLIDDILLVSDNKAKRQSVDIARYDGIAVGISSGAVLDACEQYVKIHNPQNKDIVLIFPDGYERYV